jgi:type I restriction enzyme M protein
MARARSQNSKQSSADLGFEAKLWQAADKLRSNMDAAEYKHVVLGLIFLKYISDAFEEHHATLLAGKPNPSQYAVKCEMNRNALAERAAPNFGLAQILAHRRLV